MKPWGLRFNEFFERNMFMIIPVSLILGFLFYPYLSGQRGLVPYLFAYVTFVMALGCSPSQIADALRRPLPIAVTLLLTHAAAPLLAYGGGILLFGHDSPFVIGLVLFAAIPLGVSSVIWIGLSGGNIALALSMIVIDSLLSPLTVPFLIHLFFGAQIDIDHGRIIRDLIVIIVAPTILGVCVNRLTNGTAKERTSPLLAPTSKLAFAGVVVINAAAIAPHVLDLRRGMIVLLPAVVVLVAACYGMGMLGGKWFRDRQVSVALSYSSGMRNISLGLVIGLQYFEPTAAVPVVLSILIQQPMATLFHGWIERRRRKPAGFTIT